MTIAPSNTKLEDALNDYVSTFTELLPQCWEEVVETVMGDREIEAQIAEDNGLDVDEVYEYIAENLEDKLDSIEIGLN